MDTNKRHGENLDMRKGAAPVDACSSPGAQRPKTEQLARDLQANEIERKAEIEALHRALFVQKKSRLRDWLPLFEHATWGLAIGDVDTMTIKLVNAPFAAMHGYTVEEMLGMSVDGLCAVESRAAILHRADEPSNTTQGIFECVRLRKDGSTFPARVEITVVAGVDDKTRFISSVRDLTQRKRPGALLLEQERQFRTLAETDQARI